MITGIADRGLGAGAEACSSSCWTEKAILITYQCPQLNITFTGDDSERLERTFAEEVSEIVQVDLCHRELSSVFSCLLREEY
jgi:hypothetical protein